MKGIPGVYNLLISERYESAQLTWVDQPIDFWRADLADWAESLQADRATLATWDLDAMWEIVRAANPRIGVLTQAFVTSCVDLVRTGDPAVLADNAAVRSLVERRERSQKQSQSRLSNRKLLETWSGGSGAQRMDFRWFRVRRIVADITMGWRQLKLAPETRTPLLEALRPPAGMELRRGVATTFTSGWS